MTTGSDILEFIKHVDKRSKLCVYGYLRQTEQCLFITSTTNRMTLPESIYHECLLYYHINYEAVKRMANVYDIWIDPTHSGHDIHLTHWLHSMHGIEFEGDELVQQQIFNLMDADQDGTIHKSDFVVFTTSIYHHTQQQQLQSAIIDATNIDEQHEEYQARSQKAFLSKKDRLTKLELQCQSVRQGIVPRKDDQPELFERTNIKHWVIHQVIHWMDSIGLGEYSKYFADFERPISGQKLLDYANMYLFRLEIDFDIPTHDALKMVREIDKLRAYMPQPRKKEEKEKLEEADRL